MKAKRLNYFLLLIVGFVIITLLYYKLIYNERFVQVSENISTVIRNEYKNTYENKLGLNHFDISKENFKTLSSLATDTLNLEFASTYTGLTNSDLSNRLNKFYILINPKQKQTDKTYKNNYYIAFDLKNVVKIDDSIALKMKETYKKEIMNNQLKIDRLNYSSGNTNTNTETVKILKKEIDTYFNDPVSKSVINLRFNLAAFPIKTTKIKTGFLSRKYIYDKLGIKENEYQKTEGQITTITDSYDSDGNIVNRLSNFDLNTLCPQNCP